jgi:predicted Zn-dependent protease
MQAIWNYARGMAEARTNHPEAAARHLAKLAAIAKEPRMVFISPSSVNGKPSLLEIARDVLEGEIRATQGKHDEAIVLLKRAVQTEDSMTFEEPPAWFFAVRHSLGAILLKAGKAAEAEAVYKEDLERYPANGWGLIGLANAQRSQGKSFEAEQTMSQFRTAWRRADVKITGSRF